MNEKEELQVNSTLFLTRSLFFKNKRSWWKKESSSRLGQLRTKKHKVQSEVILSNGGNR
jgi:hypothetical protein